MPLEALLKSEFIWEEGGTTQALARTTKDAQVLARLSVSNDSSTRHAVATNPWTNADVLDGLSLDADISSSLWQAQAGSVECLIVHAVIKNRSLSEATASRLASTDPIWTRKCFEQVHGFQLFDEVGIPDSEESQESAQGPGHYL